MHRRAWVTSVLVALVGCTSSAHAPTSARCAMPTVVNQVDVDGDGAPDVVTVIPSAQMCRSDPTRGPYTVQVRTATGGLSSLQLRADGWLGGHRTPWVGATPITAGLAGEQLVLGDHAGAHSVQYDVLAWQHGGLIRLASPDGSRWFVNGSVGTGILDYMCAGDALIAQNVAARGTPYRVTRTWYHWRARGWHELRRRAFVSTGTPPDLAGDNCRGVLNFD